MKHKLIVQNFVDGSGSVTEFTDAKQFHHSVTVQARDIKIVSGPAKPSDIARDINRHAAISKGQLVGFYK